jgi:hypothetical protein
MNEMWDVPPSTLVGSAGNASLLVEETSHIMSNDSDNIMYTPSSEWTSSSTTKAPAWMVEFVEFRQRLFLQTVEPIIVRLLGPAFPEPPHLQLHVSPTPVVRQKNNSLSAQQQHDVYSDDPFRNITASGIDSPTISSFDFSVNSTIARRFSSKHRRQLGFLPDYVEDASSIRETSMSFATLITLFATMASILLIFLSCFYHNQK